MNKRWSRTISTVILLVAPLACPRTTRAQTKLHPKKAEPASIQILETARNLFEQGDFDNARKFYLQALEAYPKDVELLKNLAFCYYAMGPAGRTRALHFYSLAYKLSPTSPEVATPMAKCLVELKRNGEAAGVLRKLAAQADAGPETWKMLAEAYANGGQVDQGVAAYETYLKRIPDDWGARTKLGILYGRQTAYTKAQREFQTVLAQNPQFLPALAGKAQVLSWQGQHAESLRIYDRLVRSEPANAEIASGRAFTLLWSGREQEAEEVFKKLHERFPQDKELAKGLEDAQSVRRAKADAAKPHDEAYYRDRLARNPLDAAALKALTAIASTPQRCAESIELGRKALEVSPGDLSLELTLANSLAACAQYNEAILRYRHFLATEPKAEGVHYLLAQALLRSHQTAESVTVLEELLKLDPANLDARLTLAQARAALGHYAQALARYDEVLGASPENYDALQGKAFVLYWTKQFAPSRVIFETLAGRRPNDAQNPEALKDIARAEDDARWAALRPPPGSPPEQFASFYEKRLVSYPDDTEALRGLAGAQAQMKDYAAAIQSYRELARKKPKDVEVQKEWARILRLNHQYEESISTYREVIKASPADTMLLAELAETLIDASLIKEAAEVYRELAARDPANLGYKLEAARLEKARKDYPAAREVLASVLLAEPRNHEARIALAQMELDEGAWDASFRHFGQLLREDANDADASMGLARIAYYRGDLPTAQTSAAAVVKRRPNDFEALFLLAQIEHARGNRRTTLDLLNQASQLSPADPEVSEMKRRVSEESTVTITTSAVFAREIGSPTPCTDPQGCGSLDLHEDLRTASYGTTIRMLLLPRTESYFSFTALPSQSPLGRDAAGLPILTGTSGAVSAGQFLYRQSTQVSSRIAVRAGAGWVRFGPSTLVSIPGQAEPITSAGSSPLAQVGLTFTPSRKVRADLDFNRSAVAYTPVAVRLGVIENRAQASLSFPFSPRTELHTEFFYALYSSAQYLHATELVRQKVLSSKRDYNQSRGLFATFNRNLFQSPRFSFDAGVASRFWGFGERPEQAYMGFFSPGFYQSHMLTTHFAASLGGPLRLDFSGGLGVQQIEHSGAFTRALNLSPAVIISMSRKFSLTVGYLHYNTGQSLGYLSGNAIRLSTEWRN